MQRGQTLVHCNYKPGAFGGIEQVVAKLIKIIQSLGQECICIHGAEQTSRDQSVPGLDLHSRRILFKVGGCPVLHFGNAMFLRCGLGARLIIFQEPFPSLWPAMFLLNWVFRKKIIVLVHATPSAGKAVRFLYSVMRRIIFYGCEFVTTSPQLKRRLRVSGGNASITVIPLAIPDIHSSSQWHGYSEGKKYALYFGRLADYKGIPVLMQAAERLRDINFVIAGHGKLGVTISEAIAQWGLKNIEFVNRELSEQEKANLICGSHCVIFPSTSINEAFGLVQLEAMQVGRPLINTNLATGVNFVAPNHLCALTVTPGSVSELTRAVRLLWECEPLARKLGIQGRQRYERLFTEAQFNNAWRSLLINQSTRKRECLGHERSATSGER